MLSSPLFARAVAVAAGALLLGAVGATAADAPLRVIVFGAHPDDCDIDAGGTAALWAAKGHLVKFVALTNGDAGHQSQGGGMLAKRRRLEAQEAGRRLGIAEYEVLDNHDGELEPSLAVRQQVIRRIRQWKADVVIAPRPNDYHPDHRYTGVLVQDSAYMVVKLFQDMKFFENSLKINQLQKGKSKIIIQLASREELQKRSDSHNYADSKI